jgi:aminopeptidase N
MADNNEYVWDIYKETPKMSTYLLAFVVSRFTFRQSKTLNNGVEFRTWSRKSVMDQTGLAAEIGPKLIEFFEKQFKIPYPLPKLDVIAVPDLIIEAMENWGLITCRESYILFKEGTSSAAQQALINLVLAHEISHQWLGNLVTMDWWTE